jgi:uncharacterized protein YybS (DUF2232 family)
MNSDRQRQAAAVWLRPMLICLCFLLPSALPPLFVWMNPLLAVPVFLLFETAASERQAAAQLRNGLLAAAAAVLLIGRTGQFAASLTMLPLGWALHRSERQGIPPAAAGGIGLAALSLSWLLFWGIYGLSAGFNPCSSLQLALVSSIDQTAAVWREMPDLPADALYNLELLAAWLREFLPRVLPGLLAAAAAFTVWLNMVIGNRLLRRLRSEQSAWPKFQYWRLPDALIWLLIAAVSIALAAADSLKDVGCSLIVVSGLLYFFQGAAVFIHMLHRWNVPLFWRIVLYLTVTAQGYGILLLAVTGVADTWADFRRLTRPADGSFE